MMLFYKAWRESRRTFLWGLLLLLVYVSGAILLREPVRAPGHIDAWHQFVTSQIFSGNGKGLFVLLTILLGPAGLLRERSQHRAIFTLSLPVRRLQILATQFSVGLIEIALLALLPALLVPLLSMAVHQSYPLNEAMRYWLLRSICGAEIFALAFALSTIVSGTYTAAIACWIAVLLQARAASWRPIERFDLNPLRTMDWGRSLQDLNGPFPWLALSLLTVIAILLFVIAARITERQNI